MLFLICFQKFRIPIILFLNKPVLNIYFFLNNIIRRYILHFKKAVDIFVLQVYEHVCLNNNLRSMKFINLLKN